MKKLIFVLLVFLVPIALAGADGVDDFYYQMCGATIPAGSLLLTKQMHDPKIQNFGDRTRKAMINSAGEVVSVENGMQVCKQGKTYFGVQFCAVVECGSRLVIRQYTLLPGGAIFPEYHKTNGIGGIGAMWGNPEGMPIYPRDSFDGLFEGWAHVAGGDEFVKFILDSVPDSAAGVPD